jgi:hypothetical protein
MFFLINYAQKFKYQPDHLKVTELHSLCSCKNLKTEVTGPLASDVLNDADQ